MPLQFSNHRFASRRSFLKKTSIIALGSTLPSPAFLSFDTVSKDQIIKVGLIGCGGRGTGAAIQALQADQNCRLTAMADIFQDRMDESYAALMEVRPQQVKVDKKHQYLGFDAFEKLINSDVDVVLLTSPPAFRPLHLKAAVQAKKHIFCEKPMAVDIPGLRSVMESVKKAKESNLSVVSGFCFRYDLPNRAIFSKVLDGAIGQVKSISTFRYGGEATYVDPRPEWNKMMQQMRNWMYYNWLSGDFIVEQAVHSLDMMSWAMGDIMPISAMGTGGRQVRIDPKYGNIYDHFAVEFRYQNGAIGTHFCRQQAGTTPRNTVSMLGTEGQAEVVIGAKQIISGKVQWHYDGPKNNMYQTQHDELFAAIRNNKPINDGEWMANSTLLAIWARMVGYTGQILTFDQVINSKESLGPDLSSYDWEMNFDGPAVAIPGKTRFS
ncbi:Gfo/Idh/MocA family oxidoreductase [Sphingobacterium thalpophilum]|uniref:Gfo/Idh/MocA family oxidoreductase n=1 Tax=Sphingobacterium thalpophilum TaxID=259 RepID=A0ABV4HAD1_9SPHI|nr:Gfo/Idh/MocA family oxidoreductase [Sphingobacterium thalpophilum]